MTQQEFANLMQTCVMTISKWERGLLFPGPSKTGFLNACKKAADKEPFIGLKVKYKMVEKGLMWGSYYILHSIGEYGPQ